MRGPSPRRSGYGRAGGSIPHDGARCVTNLAVIARSTCDEAIQSLLEPLDCFVASLLAMTEIARVKPAHDGAFAASQTWAPSLRGALATKQSSPCWSPLDCLVASLLAMTEIARVKPAHDGELFRCVTN